jgi:hypothetical protein
MIIYEYTDKSKNAQAVYLAWKYSNVYSKSTSLGLENTGRKTEDFQLVTF